jgi:hypothetical protein
MFYGFKSIVLIAQKELNPSLTVAYRQGIQKYFLAVYTQHKK